MSIPASTILDSAAGTLLDTAHRTWGADELLGYLNEALRATANVKPDIYVVQNGVTLAAGVQQSLPDDGLILIDIPRNGTAGRTITQVDKGLLDEAYRFWPSATQEATVDHFTYDPRNPLHFVVYPPNDGTGVVEMFYGAVPPQLMYAAEEVPIRESYQTVLTDFVLSKAYQKNSKRQDLAKAQVYLTQWGQGLGLRSQAQIAAASKVASSPGT